MSFTEKEIDQVRLSSKALIVANTWTEEQNSDWLIESPALEERVAKLNKRVKFVECWNVYREQQNYNEDSWSVSVTVTTFGMHLQAVGKSKRPLWMEGEKTVEPGDIPVEV